MADPFVVVDTEGSGLYPDDGARVSVISWAFRRSDGTIESDALPFGQGPIGQLFDVQEDAGPEKWEWLLDWLGTCRLGFHNAAHDLQELNAGGLFGYPGRSFVDQFWWDTSVVQKHLDPLEKVGLEESCVRRLGVERWKWRVADWLTHTGRRFDVIPWSEIKPYATEDAVNTLLLQEDQVSRLEAGEGTPEIVDREHQITRVLFNMEVRGVGFDAEECAAAAKVLTKRSREAADKLPRELNPPTQQKMARYYYDQLGYLPARLDENGDLVRSVDELSRKVLRDQGAPWIDELDAWAELETAVTSWYTPWARAIGPDGRLRMRVRQTKVTSGRFSGERVNLLAIPHDDHLPDGVPSIRSLIRPAPGKQLWEVDLGQAEVRVAAIAADCGPMRRAFEQHLDPYAVTAQDVFGIGPDHDEFSMYRGLCKRIVLSTIYSGGAKTLIATAKRFMGLDLSEKEAQGYLRSFRNTYPEFGEATQKWEQFALKNGFVPLALGERRYFQSYEMMCSKCKGSGCQRCRGTGKQAYKALNQRIQGSVAAVMKPCMIDTEREFPGVLLLQTHDALLLEISDLSIPEKVGAIMRDNFERVFKLPFTTEIKQWS